MKEITVICALLCAYVAYGEANYKGHLDVIKRSQWNAKKPLEFISNFQEIPSSVVIFESGTDSCYSERTCKNIVQMIQEDVIDQGLYEDIPYNFLIDEYGNIFEGTGWNKTGAHTSGYIELNKFVGRSLEVCIIGTFKDREPSSAAIDALKKLIKFGTDMNLLSSLYNVYPAESLSNGRTPTQLYKQIEKFRQWQDNPIAVTRYHWNVYEPESKPIYFADMATLIVLNYLGEMSEVRSDTILALQKYDREFYNWTDTACNFVISSKGVVFEGSGWNALSPHFRNYNQNTLEFCIIGEFNDVKFSALPLVSMQLLVKYGIAFGKINSTYMRYGIRHVTPLIEPVPNLYQYTKLLPFYQPFPYLISRSGWEAEAPSSLGPIFPELPSTVIIFFMLTQNCTSMKECAAIMQGVQNHHMADYEWTDIGFNFLLDNMGNVYEGRGWNQIGGYSMSRDVKSLEICIIGDFNYTQTSHDSMEAMINLFAYGTAMEKMSAEYTVYTYPYEIPETNKINGKLITLPVSWPGSFNLISRSEWNATDYKFPRTIFKNLPTTVFVTDTFTPGCTVVTDCINIVKNLQEHDMKIKKWDDIGCNFLIGEDGNVYEGRGWNIMIEAAAEQQDTSLRICMIGQFENREPSTQATTALKNLLAFGVVAEYLNSSYILQGELQISTFSPGTELYNSIKQLPHWQP